LYLDDCLDSRKFWVRAIGATKSNARAKMDWRLLLALKVRPQSRLGKPPLPVHSAT